MKQQKIPRAHATSSTKLSVLSHFVDIENETGYSMLWYFTVLYLEISVQAYYYKTGLSERFRPERCKTMFSPT